VTYAVAFSQRAVRDFDRLGRDVQKRILDRLDQISQTPHDHRLSLQLTGHDRMRRSRVGGWRILFTIDDAVKAIAVVMIERRGQVYKRI
jgi:mRNA interferase RelE/StbE